MRFVRIGNRIINLKQVKHIQVMGEVEEGQRALVVMGEGLNLMLRPEDTEAFLSYLERAMEYRANGNVGGIMEKLK